MHAGKKNEASSHVGEVALALEGSPAILWDCWAIIGLAQPEELVEGVEPGEVVVPVAVVVPQGEGLHLAVVPHQERPHAKAAAGMLKAWLKSEGGAIATLQDKLRKHFFLFL